MLSQRIAMNHMLAAAGPDTVDRSGDGRDEFRKSLNTLLSESNYSVQIGDRLAGVTSRRMRVESAPDRTDDTC